MRFELNCVVGRDGRLEGTLGWPGHAPVPFSGTLELLRLIEDHTPRRPVEKSRAKSGTSERLFPGGADDRH